MKIEIEIDGVEPLSLNNAQKISARFNKVIKYKTDKTKLFESQINSKLNAFKSEFRKLNKAYDEKKNYLVVDYVFYIPVLVKDKSRISKTSKDVDNIIKPLQDLIFKHLNADDSSIVAVSSTKIHSDKLKIKANIYMYDLKNIA